DQLVTPGLVHAERGQLQRGAPSAGGGRLSVHAIPARTGARLYYSLAPEKSRRPTVRGTSVARGGADGRARKMRPSLLSNHGGFPCGAVLVVPRTSEGWLPAASSSCSDARPRRKAAEAPASETRS